jgi:hypothetical protein
MKESQPGKVKGLILNIIQIEHINDRFIDYDIK